MPTQVKSIDYIQSEESRTKAINRFCWFIFSLGIFYSVLFLVFKLYMLVAMLTFISLAFRYFIFLNTRSKHDISKNAIILTTNVGVLAFSCVLGFNSGVYLYLFAAPMLIYLIFDFTQKKAIYINLVIYVINFLVISYIHHFKIIAPIDLSNFGLPVIDIIYTINFVFTFLLCFCLIIYFSNNNHGYFESLIRSGKDKDILLSEIHHRVKNNLAVISSLIELQSLHIKDESAINVLQDSIRRIKAIGLLHEKLYNSQNFEKVQIAEYIFDLVEHIKTIFPMQSKNISFELSINPVELSIQEALPLSLILNELIINALKHAFNATPQGVVKINVEERKGRVKVKVSDNGCGFNLNEEALKNSLGIHLIHSLSEQLGNKPSLISGSSGTYYNLEFITEKST
ncbi:MAG: hypothetical protein JWO32_1982 [Bacteroidetes bacterium]|nr:hypothetical protein [Bacteroidota bacterium]